MPSRCLAVRAWSLRAHPLRGLRGWTIGAWAGVACATLLIASPAQGQAGPAPDSAEPDALTAPEPTSDDEAALYDPELERLAGLSLEELMSIEVTSVAGVEAPWFNTPAAVYVITPEDVRRTGHQTLAEALRLVPGMHVARIASSQWRVEPRGLTGVTIRSNKNLVLIDGRSVWDPLYSGVWWDAQDILLEDLDRIEVIRGPGATLWGSNAVNGVINVVTRSARDTQGLYLTSAVGTHIEGMAGVRYGGQLNERTWYRVWSKYASFGPFNVRPQLQASIGDTGHDDWSVGRMGFRIDGEGGDDVTYTLQGETYTSFTYGSRTNSPVPNATFQFEEIIGDGRIAGGHLLGRLVHEPVPGEGWSLQTYYDRTERTAIDGFNVDRDTFDLELRNWFDWGERQSLIWGLRANYNIDDTRDSSTLSLDPASTTHYLFSGFAQNTTEFVDDTLFAMVGSKLEYNDVTGVEVQPSARLWWTPNDRHILWGGVSRAVRVPSRLEHDGTFTSAYVDEGVLAGGAPTNTFARFGVTGNDELDSEELIAYELGHRVRLTPNLTLDHSVFYHDYDNLIYTDVRDTSPLVRFTGDGYGESYGLESSVMWQVAPNWRLQAAYSYVRVHVGGPIPRFENENTPQHQAQLRSYLDVTDDLELNAAIYYVDNLPSAAERSRVRLDLGATWHVNEHFDLTVWGQNLLDPEHSEASALEVPRAVYVQGTLRF